MTKPPKLYPRHRHEWQPTLIRNQVVCTVCGFTVPANAARLDDPDATLEKRRQ